MLTKKHIILILFILVFVNFFIFLFYFDKNKQTGRETVYEYCDRTIDSLCMKIVFCDIDIFKSNQAKNFINKKLNSAADTDTWLARDTFRKISTLLDNELYFNLLITNLQNVSYYDIDSFDLNNAEKNINRLKQWKVSIAYRKGGAELAYQICNGFTSEDYLHCKETVELVVTRLENFRDNRETCQGLIKNYDDFMCSFP